MIKAISYSKYLTETGHAVIPPTVLFKSKMIEKIPQEVLSEILSRVEETRINQGLPIAKFQQNENIVIDWSKLSAGTQTALLIAYYTYTNTTAYVWLGQCGGAATAMCLTLLNQSEYVTAVVAARPPCRSSETDLPVICDGVYYAHWKSMYIEWGR